MGHRAGVDGEDQERLRSRGERPGPPMWEIQSPGKEGARVSGVIQAGKRRCYAKRLQKGPQKGGGGRVGKEWGVHGSCDLSCI